MNSETPVPALTGTVEDMVLEAGYPGTSGFRKVVKATILVKKKPGMSDEDFIEHYNHKHAQMAAPVLEKHKIITYSLVCLFYAIHKSAVPFPGFC